LFERGTQSAWNWVKQAQFICWFAMVNDAKSFVETRQRLSQRGEAHWDYHRCKVWREGLEVAMKIKGSVRRRVEWVYAEHPFTAISCASEVHANHNEAQNALRRRSPCLSQTTEPYAKRVQITTSFDVQRLVHNCASSLGLGKSTTPAMAMSFCNRPVSQ